VRRREFITLVGGTAAGWPFAARAQQPAMSVVGYLHVRSAADAPHLAQAFRSGLDESGFIEGQNVKIEFRWADGQYNRLRALADELAQIPVAVIVAAGGALAVEAAEAASSSIPLVFSMSGDPFKLGLADSFNRPGRNATGMNVLSATMEPKRLGLLHELVPDVTAVAAMILTTDSLLSFMHMEVAVAAANGARLTSCKRCGDVFLTGKLTKRRSTAKYCSDRCRIGAHRANGPNRKGG
jgi:putative ABC transport system substrate-binding protein